MRVLGQLVDQLLHFARQRDRGQVQWRRLVTVGLHERFVGQPDGSYAGRRIVDGYVVSQRDDRSAKENEIR